MLALRLFRVAFSTGVKGMEMEHAGIENVWGLFLISE